MICSVGGPPPIGYMSVVFMCACSTSSTVEKSPAPLLSIEMESDKVLFVALLKAKKNAWNPYTSFGEKY